jgi:hypothetical protein
MAGFRLWMVVSLVLLGACGDKEDDTSGGSDDTSAASDDTSSGTDDTSATDDTGSAADCATMDPTTCAGRSDCSTIDGRQMQDDGSGGQCVDYSQASEPVGCMNADWGCDDAETLAADPASPDACWWFPSGCLPTGWVSCQSGEYGECAR